MHTRKSKTLIKLCAVLGGLAIVAGACSSDKKAETTTKPGDATTTAVVTTAVPNTAVSTTLATTPPELKPVAGGKLVMAIEAETSSGWTPASMICAISCHTVARSVYDTLTLVGADGSMQPNLLKSIKPSADYKTWTLTAREGIKFHDGTPFNGAAIADNLSRHQKAFLTGKAFKDVESVTVDPANPMVAIAKMKRPWVSFPVYLAGQIGYMASPTWLKAVEGDPTLATKPVGTGPFIYKEFVANDHFTATKNKDYWRSKDGYPYLDEVTFRPLDDQPQRVKGLEGGTFDMTHLSSGKEIVQVRDEAAKFNMIETTKYGETNYVLLNVANEGANATSPILDQRIRCAMANAYDQTVLNTNKYKGVDKVANGPFSPDQIGYLADSGYPKFDVAAGKALVDAYKKEKGVNKVEIKLTTTPSPDAQEDQTVFAGQMKEIGIDATLNNVEQGAYIVTALKGDFQVFAWRNHGGVDPDAQRIWWHSEAADPLGAFGLNFGRIKDPNIDKQLDIIRESPDAAVRKTAAEEINRIFGKQCYDLWDTWTTWAIASNKKIHGIQDYKLPDGGDAAFGSGIAGTFQIAAIWKEA